MAFQSTRPSQSLTTEGLVRPWKENSSLLSQLAIGPELSGILMGDSLVPTSTSIGFSGAPGMGTGGGGGDGDWNSGRIGKGSGEGAHPLWFFLKCIRSHRDFFMVRMSSNNIVAFAFCFRTLCSICHIVEWR